MVIREQAFFTDISEIAIRLSHHWSCYLPTTAAFLASLLFQNKSCALRLASKQGVDIEQIIHCCHRMQAELCLQDRQVKFRERKARNEILGRAFDMPLPSLAGCRWIDTAHLLAAVGEQRDCAAADVLDHCRVDGRKWRDASVGDESIHEILYPALTLCGSVSRRRTWLGTFFRALAGPRLQGRATEVLNISNPVFEQR
jgi:hypothetical protein